MCAEEKCPVLNGRRNADVVPVQRASQHLDTTIGGSDDCVDPPQWRTVRDERGKDPLHEADLRLAIVACDTGVGTSMVRGTLGEVMRRAIRLMPGSFAKGQ